MKSKIFSIFIVLFGCLLPSLLAAQNNKNSLRINSDKVISTFNMSMLLGSIIISHAIIYLRSKYCKKFETLISTICYDHIIFTRTVLSSFTYKAWAHENFTS